MANNQAVCKIVNKLKKCYKERNPDNIDSLMELLFDPSDNPIVIGTTRDEWKFGNEDVKGIFISDWNGWGNVEIKLPSLVLENKGAYGWFYVDASVEFSFTDDDGKYDYFMGLVVDYAKSSLSSLTKAGAITWLLSLLLHSRENGERKYLLDLTISGILKNISEPSKLKIIQFSHPVLTAYSGIRRDSNEDDAMHFDWECKKIRTYNMENHIETNDELKGQFITLFNNSKLEFINDDLSRYIGMDGIKRNGHEFNDYIGAYSKNNITLKLGKEHLIIDNMGDEFCICGVGIISRTPSLDDELNAVLQNIDFYSSQQNKKDALFNLRRDLTQVIKEASFESEVMEPFRVEGIGKYDDSGNIVIEYMQLSYPNDWVLEQCSEALKKI